MDSRHTGKRGPGHQASGRIDLNAGRSGWLREAPRAVSRDASELSPRAMERARQEAKGHGKYGKGVAAVYLTALLDHTGQDWPEHRKRKSHCRPRRHLPLTHWGHCPSPTHTIIQADPSTGGLQELAWGERTLTLAPLGSQQDPASPVTPPTGQGRRGTAGGTGTPAVAGEKHSMSGYRAFLEPPSALGSTARGPGPRRSRSPTWGRAQRAWASHHLLNTEVTTPAPHGPRQQPCEFSRSKLWVKSPLAGDSGGRRQDPARSTCPGYAWSVPERDFSV